MKPVGSSTQCEVVVDDARLDDVSLHPFLVSTSRGFLPLRNPLVTLPKEFDVLESLLQRMPIKTASGEPGLLAEGKLGDVVDKEFPDLTAQIDVYKDNLHVITALYRDYSFLAEGYLLEPCHRQFMESKDYGIGRPFLPKQIAGPFVKCAEIAGFKPYLEFSSYVLLNYRLENPAAGLEFSNLRLIRAFEHGLDPASSESGFILVHLTMVKHSGPLVQGVLKAFEAASEATASCGTIEQRKLLNEGLSTLVDALANLNSLMKIIYQKSKPTEYNNFRTFMFGITSNSMFPDGVVYEGCNDNKPMFFRGETGANDAMVPLMDNFLQIPMPDTPLTVILDEFSEYRSDKHKDFLNYVKERGLQLEIKKFALDRLGAASSGDVRDALRKSRGLWLQILDQVREFRWRHWNLVKEYILKRSDHPTATGGSPIVTWLPNQLEAVLDDMIQVHAAALEDDPTGLGKTCDNIMEVVLRQKETLKKEVEKYCAERG
ncbi:putative indoleamine 2,3-dioxygenase [Microsporum ferrugineum]